MGIENAHGDIEELTDYFLHRGDFKKDWSLKEKIHLEEVRRLLDRMSVAVSGNTFYIGGHFTSIGGQGLNYPCLPLSVLTG